MVRCGNTAVRSARWTGGIWIRRGGTSSSSPHCFRDLSVESPPSYRAKPRTTITPPPIAAKQAAGCSCGNALGMTAAGQAVRGIGVNTATGAFARVEQDLGMASFGVPFASRRVYSSANPAAGPFGPAGRGPTACGCVASDRGAAVRAEDGAEALFRRVNGGYRAAGGGALEAAQDRHRLEPGDAAADQLRLRSSGAG